MRVLLEFLTSFVFVWRYFFLLIFYPHRAMRKIGKERDLNQVFIIFLTVFVYLKFAYFLKSQPYPATFLFLIFLLTFFLTVFFFYFISKFFSSNIKLSPFIFTFSYAIFPSLLWYATNSLLYLILPPPRTTSVLGVSFSIFYLSYSVSLFIWKIMLVYLALRFSTAFSFWRIIYFLLLYLLVFFPYFFLLSAFGIFYIPLI